MFRLPESSGSPDATIFEAVSEAKSLRAEGLPVAAMSLEIYVSNVLCDSGIGRSTIEEIFDTARLSIENLDAEVERIAHG